ncbi:MAG: HipA domain-containing protein [Bacteroidales bacterium]|nr:HipA domain-containing protein [Bacteroidales bacterium]
MNSRCLYCYEPVENGSDFHTGCSMEFFGTKTAPLIPYTLDSMAEMAKLVVERSVTVPGVQAKLSMSLLKETQEKRQARFTVVGALGGNYIFKPPSATYPEMPQNEHLTMRLAEAFKINVVPSSLIRLESGELSYITRRVDRTGDRSKIHMLDMFQVTEAFDKYKSSMEKIGKALHKYSANTLLDKLLFFELALFSFLSGNNDMHLKNFSMVEGPSGWVLAPAYDLLNVAIILPDDDEELALTMAGKKKKFRRDDFISFSKGLELTTKQTDSAFGRMLENKYAADEWVRKSFLSEKMKKAYLELMESRYRQLGLV